MVFFVFMCDRKSLTAFSYYYFTNEVFIMVHWIPWAVIKSELITNPLAKSNTDYFVPNFGERKSDIDDFQLMSKSPSYKDTTVNEGPRKTYFILKLSNIEAKYVVIFHGIKIMQSPHTEL